MEEGIEVEFNEKTQKFEDILIKADYRTGHAVLKSDYKIVIPPLTKEMKRARLKAKIKSIAIDCLMILALITALSIWLTIFFPM